MHRTLQIPEIVDNILDYCSPAAIVYAPHNLPNKYYPPLQTSADLAALARTCRAFKQPALDVLWRDLGDLTPLVRCLPTAFRQPSGYNNLKPKYSFVRPLTQAEWGVFRSYACRIRSVLFFDRSLDWKSVARFLNPPTTDPLFPNLRALCCGADADPTMSLLRLPFPSLLHLDIRFARERVAQIALESFSKHSPNITELHVIIHRDFTSVLKINLESWQNLRSVVLPGAALDVDALGYLSRLPTLTTLKFRLNVMLITPDSSLTFLNLQVLEPELPPDCFHMISRLLSRTRPSVLFSESLKGKILGCNPSLELSSFFASFRARDNYPTIEILTLEQSDRYLWLEETIGPLVLDLEILQPCMAFRHLRRLKLDIHRDVALTSDQLLTLASEWPKLEELAINESWGWNTEGGITPCGLVQLLTACQSLERLAVRFDTRGYTEVPTGCSTLEDLECKLEEVYVLDSALEAESVAAITTLFCTLATGSKSGLCLRRWQEGHPVREFQVMVRDHERRWYDVSDEVEDAVARRFDSEAPESEADLLVYP